MTAAVTIPLRLAGTETVEVDGSFNARTTLIKPSHFPSPFDAQGEYEYWAVPQIAGWPTGIRASFKDNDTAVQLDVYLPADADYDATVISVLRGRLGLNLALPEYDELCKCDEILRQLPAPMRGARPSSPWSLYEYLTIGTILQNTVVSRTVQMARSLAQLLGTWYEFPGGPTLASFWQPSQVVDAGEQALREAKLGYRAKTLTRVGAQFVENPDLENQLWELADNPARLRAGLQRIYGVGPATTGYLMFDIFKSLQELTHLPPWEAKILGQLLFGDQSADPTETVAWCRRRWAPYTMLAVHAVFETVFWHRATGQGPQWLEPLIRL